MAEISAQEKLSAQQALIGYFRSLDRAAAREELSKIVHPNPKGARISGKELAALYDTFGCDGRKEVAKISYGFADQLAGLYRELRE